MKEIMELLGKNPQVSGWKINMQKKESFELFFVKGHLETVRSTDTCDKRVTVYVQHDAFMGDSSFFVYPSTTPRELEEKIAGAVRNAQLMKNAPYTLPRGETGTYTLPSNFSGYEPMELASLVAGTVFEANRIQGGSLNAVEIFINHYTDTVTNSRGLHKVQHRYDAMVEAIPTYNGEAQSVELYEQYNFSALDAEALSREIAGKMEEVRARYEAVKPDFSMDCPIILNKLELADLFSALADELNYATVYSHSNLYKKGDLLQEAPTGDPLTLRAAGAIPGSAASTCFDADGLDLGEIQLIGRGKVENYYGSNRFGQYLGEVPTGSLPCLLADAGTLDISDCGAAPYLEVVSMSGLQVDCFNDYIGGEIRLAYYHDGSKILPVTGISISGSLRTVLNEIRFSRETAVHDGYMGPRKAWIRSMQIF